MNMRAFTNGIPSLIAAAVVATACTLTQANATTALIGDTKETAIVITPEELLAGVSLPGTTVGYTDNFSNPGGASILPPGYGGPDVWFTFNVPSSFTLNAGLNIAGSTGDLVLFLLSAGGTNGDVIAHSSDYIGAGNGAENISGHALGAGTYYLVVDSFYDSGPESAGSYTLNISPIPQAVPEPSTALLASTLGVLAFWRRRRSDA